MKNPATTMVSERLILEPMTVEDSPDIYAMLSDETHTRYLTIPTATEPEAVEDMIKSLINNDGYCLWTLRRKTDRKFVGMCGFFNDSNTPNFVYSIAEDMKGNGYATEAGKSAIPVGAKILNIKVLELNTHEKNQASQRVAEKLGFEKCLEYEFRYPQDSQPVKAWAWKRQFDH